MSSPTTTTEDMALSLKIYAAFLRERNQVLTELATTSNEMRSLLQSDGAADIKDILAKRELECIKYANICQNNSTDDQSLLSNAQNIARSGKRESASMALSVLSLYEDSQDLASDIMTCQSECESILKTRLQATSRALQQSAQKRRLGAAYGPACKYGNPLFMDKQT